MFASVYKLMSIDTGGGGVITWEDDKGKVCDTEAARVNERDGIKDQGSDMNKERH